MASHVAALGTVVNPPPSLLTDSYDVTAEQHHAWAKCSVSETRMHSDECTSLAVAAHSFVAVENTPVKTGVI